MAKAGTNLLHRIGCIKSSLEKAEQSFMDHKEMRGELDLMLAEAELKNLRRKKDVPWMWNRQMLAGCVAALLILAGFGGWCFAKDKYQQPAVAIPSVAEKTVPAKADRLELAVTTAKAEPNKINNNIPNNSNNPSVAQAKPVQAVSQAAPARRVELSKSEMLNLVQSAKTELTN